MMYEIIPEVLLIQLSALANGILVDIEAAFANARGWQPYPFTAEATKRVILKEH